MTREQLVELAGGRIWTGRQAKANGLVDELGTLDDAVIAARKLAGVPGKGQAGILELPESRSFLDSFLESRRRGRQRGAAAGAGLAADAGAGASRCAASMPCCGCAANRCG